MKFWSLRGVVIERVAGTWLFATRAGKWGMLFFHGRFFDK